MTNTTLTLPLPHSRTRRAPTLASHCAHTSEASPPFVVVTCPFRRRSWALAVSVASVSFASTSVTWDTLQFSPSPSDSLCPHSLFLLRAVAVSPPASRPHTASLPLFKGPKDFPRGNQPPHPVFAFPALGCARLLTGVKSRRRRATPSWTATLWCLCTDVVSTLVLTTLPLTSLSPSWRLGAPSAPAPSSPAGLHRGHERRRRWWPGRLT